MGNRNWIALAVVGVVVAAALHGQTPERKTSPAAAMPARAINPVQGTPSCSGRGCHGNLEAVANDATQPRLDEYIRWLQDDPHRNAAAVLDDDRSQKIIARLTGTKVGERKASEDVRCLACHADPVASRSTGKNLASERHAFGTGCESCHGPAETWLAAHTSRGAVAAQGRKSLHMKQTDQLVERVNVCVDCHVGAPEKDGAPRRDVNHDLIAAGHPRLNFEYAAYMANLPPHWRSNNLKKEKNSSELRSWAVGQILTARAVLDLLVDRLDENTKSPAVAPWPEFAEYQCYACHHDLSPEEKTWRRTKDHYAGRTLGAYPWQRWSMPMVEFLAVHGPDVFKVASPKDLVARIDGLTRMMTKPAHNRETIRDEAEKLSNDLRDWANRIAAATPVEGAARQLAVALIHDAGSLSRGWDLATQALLANEALSEGDTNPPLREALKKLFKTLDDSMIEGKTDSKSGERINSPVRYDPTQVDAVIEELRSILPKKK